VSSNQAASVNLDDLRALIAEELELPVDDVTEDADLANDLEVDSLTAMEIAVQLENKYQIKIAEEEIKLFTSVRKIQQLVSAKVETA
jgi:acyl carrier protein